MENQQNSVPTNTYTVVKERRSGWGRGLLISCVLLFFVLLCACGGFILLMSGVGNLGGKNLMNDVSVDENVVSEAGDTSSLSTSKIAVIDIAGAISYVLPSDASGSSANNKTIIAQLKKAKADSAVKVVVLRFNSPGGAVSAAEPICREIKSLAENKPVYSYIDTEGASLAYLLPNCTDFIYARPDTITGSIGVIISLTDINGVIEKVGGKTATITNTAGKEKAGDGLFVPGSEEYKRLQSMLDETYEYFIAKVWEGRQSHGRITYAKLREVADGRIFSGKQAYELGLVDQVEYYDDVITDVISKNSSKFSGDKIEIVEYSIPVDPFSSLFGAMSTISKITTSEGSINTRKMELLYLSNL